VHKKIFIIALLLLSTFIAGYYQRNIFLSSTPVPMSYFYILIFIDAIIIGMAIIVFDYVFESNYHIEDDKNV